MSTAIETDTSNTEIAAGIPTAQVSKATFFSKEKYPGLTVRTVLRLIFSRMKKKYSIEMMLDIIVANAAPETSMPKPNGIVIAPPSRASPFSKMKIGSRMIFIIPPRDSPIPASFVLPTARTRRPAPWKRRTSTPPFRAWCWKASSNAENNSRYRCHADACPKTEGGCFFGSDLVIFA